MNDDDLKQACFAMLSTRPLDVVLRALVQADDARRFVHDGLVRTPNDAATKRPGKS